MLIRWRHMEMIKLTIKKIRNRDNERGAALVSALLVTFLLLVASAGLLLESSLNSQNVTDATAEQQAYNAAESGIQSAINVLRGNVTASTLIDTSKPATDPANKIDFVKALKVSTSNLPTDTSSVARLSRWLGYNSTCPDRVVMGSTTCDLMNGYAYSLSISDPDNTGSQVSYNTKGKIFDNDGPGPVLSTEKTYGNATNGIHIKYYPTTVTNLDVSAGEAASDFGYFKVTLTGTGATIPGFNRFEIVLNMTKPYTATRVIRGYIQTNTSSNTPPKIIFDSRTHSLMGSSMDLEFAWGSPANVAVLGPPQRYGYEAQLSASTTGVDNLITGVVSAPEPTRLLLTSTGYGPRGSSKRLESIIQKDLFAGLRAPSTLTLIGPTHTITPPTTFTFNPGSSTTTGYSGHDTVSTDIIPPIGTSNPDNLGDVEESVDGMPPHPFNGTVIGSPADISGETPDYLKSPAALDAVVRSLATIAQSSGRFYPNGTTPPDFGNNTTGTGITFCDGNCTLSGDGGGILVVAGKLTFTGSFDFKGFIIVTGKDGVARSGGGNGSIEGNIVIAPYVGCRIEDGITPALTDDFLSPQYDLSGGGNSIVVYNSATTASGMIAVSNFVLGVVEK